MNTTQKSFTLRPHNAIGVWCSDDRRHYENAVNLLASLETVIERVTKEWPSRIDATVTNSAEGHPELWALVRQRDQLSDSVRIFAAMSAEGFLNFYGVVRLGEAVFKAHFERLGLIPKLQMLLLVCDSLSVSSKDPIVLLLSSLADSRNALVHPKTRELPGCVPAEQRPGVQVPGAARDAVCTMKKFFEEFVKLVPDAHHLVPPLNK